MLRVFLLRICLPVTALVLYPNIQVVGSLSIDPEEVTISINPPENISAVANITYCYYLTDGGHTWTEV